MPTRLAILEADTPVPGTVLRHENYTGVFTTLFSLASAPASLSSRFSISRHHVVDDSVPRTPYPSLSDIDAVLISGSKHNAHDDDPWILELIAFIRKCLDSGRVRVVGVCFGHQVTARALGMRVGVNELGWEVSVTEMDTTEAGKKVFGVDRLKIYQMHRDIVFDTDNQVEKLEIIASNDNCRNQGMYVPGQLITIQGHPEFTPEIVSEILKMRHDGGVFDDAMYQDGMGRVDDKHDGIKIARAFLRFCEE